MAITQNAAQTAAQTTTQPAPSTVAPSPISSDTTKGASLDAPLIALCTEIRSVTVGKAEKEVYTFVSSGQDFEIWSSKYFAAKIGERFTPFLAFTLFACSSDDGDNSNYDMLNGVWDRGDIVVTFTNDKGVFTQVKSGSEWEPFINNGIVNIGDIKFRNIKQTGDLTWAGQELCYTIGTFNTNWHDCTITVNANGRTLIASVPSCNGSSSTYTKE